MGTTYATGLTSTSATPSTVATILAFAARHNVKGRFRGLKLVKLDCMDWCWKRSSTVVEPELLLSDKSCLVRDPCVAA